MPHQTALLPICTFSLLIAALTSGGGTHAGYLSDVVLELLACPILLLLLWQQLTVSPVRSSPQKRLAFGFTAALLTAPLLQLMPVPPSQDALLRRGRAILDGLDLIGPAQTWRPITVSTEATWLAWLSLLPAIALFWTVAALDWRARRALCGVIVLAGFVSCLVGLLQLAGGPDSSLRFYEFTNRDAAVGFFANRNHFAALLYCATLFAGACGLALWNEAASRKPHHSQSARIFYAALAFCLVVAMTVMQGMTRSRAGVLLHGAALLSLIAMAPATFQQKRSHTRKIAILAAAVSVGALGQLLLFRFIDRFTTETLAADSRLVFLANTLDAARVFMPFGSGLGSFVRVYGSFEKPADTLAERFANHAHNDWAELWLETGVAGMGLAVAFVVWVVWQIFRQRQSPPAGGATRDVLLQRAGLVAITLLLLHSFVDYPLRTEAMMAVFALSAGLQFPAPLPTSTRVLNLPGPTHIGQWRRQALARSTEPALAKEAVGAALPLQALGAERWQPDIPWPVEWT